MSAVQAAGSSLPLIQSTSPLETACRALEGYLGVPQKEPSIDRVRGLARMILNGQKVQTLPANANAAAKEAIQTANETAIEAAKMALEVAEECAFEGFYRKEIVKLPLPSGVERDNRFQEMCETMENCIPVPHETPSCDRAMQLATIILRYPFSDASAHVYASGAVNAIDALKKAAQIN